MAPEEAASLRPPVVTAFTIETEPVQGCSSDNQCDPLDVCVAFKCIRSYCFYGPMPDGRYCGIGGQQCQTGKCTAVNYPLYEAPPVSDWVVLVSILVLGLLSIWIIREYSFDAPPKKESPKN